MDEPRILIVSDVLADAVEKADVEFKDLLPFDLLCEVAEKYL